MHRIKAWMCRALELLRQNWKSAVYYGGVVLTLAAVAWAAEIYRSEPEKEALILPAVDIADAAAEEKPFVEIAANMTPLRGFNAQPEWNAELGMWEIHAARDYTLQDGAVTALCAGAVAELGCDAANGGFVAIASDDIVLRYCSIEPEEGLAVGDRVKRGEKIGTVDESMPCECYLGAHLHLEASLNGEAADVEMLTEEKRAGEDKTAPNS